MPSTCSPSGPPRAAPAPRARPILRSTMAFRGEAKRMPAGEELTRGVLEAGRPCPPQCRHSKSGRGPGPRGRLSALRTASRPRRRTATRIGTPRRSGSTALRRPRPSTGTTGQRSRARGARVKESPVAVVPGTPRGPRADGRCTSKSEFSHWGMSSGASRWPSS